MAMAGRSPKRGQRSGEHGCSPGDESRTAQRLGRQLANGLSVCRGKPATSVMSDWLTEETVKEMISPPTQPVD
jgi:hypothetical protein